MAIYNAKIEIYEIITSEGDEKKENIKLKKKTMKTKKKKLKQIFLYKT